MMWISETCGPEHQREYRLKRAQCTGDLDFASQSCSLVLLA